MRQLCLWSALVVGLGAALLSAPGYAVDKVDADTIDKLVKQLASGRFAEREKAHKKLDEIGLPALDALKKAAETGDPETKRRAGELIDKFQKQAAAAKVLAPTKVKLSFKDTPLKDAIAELNKKGGCRIGLVDPQNKLKDRKITLETAEITFWDAFEQFCQKAGLVEAEINEAVGGDPGAVPQPGIDLPLILPVPPQVAPPVEAVPPQPPVRERPIKKQPLEKKPIERKQIEKVGGLAVQVEEKIQVEVKPQVGKAQAKPAQAQPAQVRPGRRPIRIPPPQPQMQEPNTILLKDGKPTAVPTDVSGAVRFKAIDTAIFGKPQDKETMVVLKVTPEPKLRWQQTVNVAIEKAIDDQGQNLTMLMNMNQGQPEDQAIPFGRFNGPAILPVFPGGGGGIGFGGGFAGMPFGGQSSQILPIRLTKGEKAAKMLKEFKGAITAQILTEPEVYMTADNVAKAVGKTFKGKDGGSIKVNGFDEQNGQITLRLEVDLPKDVVPAGQPNFNGGGFGFGGFGGRGIIMPVPVPVPAPAPAKEAPAEAPAKKQARAAAPAAFFQVAAAQQAPAQAQIKVVQAQQIAVQQIIIGPGGFGGGGIAFPGGAGQGFELIDEKGNVIPCLGGGIGVTVGPGGQNPVQEHHLTFQIKEGQKAAKLVFKGSKVATVNVPFSLKEITLP